MTLSRAEQVFLAKDILHMTDKFKDEPAVLELIHELTVGLVKLSGFESNGVAFSLQEYVYEMNVIANGQKDTGWKQEALRALNNELGR